MFKKINCRVPIDIFETLQEQAMKRGISISDVVRERLLSFENPKNETSILFASTSPSSKNENIEPGSGATKDSPSQEIDAATLEILFLLREFLLERNAQVLKKVDEKLEKRFGKERKRIL